jgi:hypothetical protein
VRLDVVVLNLDDRDLEALLFGFGLVGGLGVGLIGSWLFLVFGREEEDGAFAEEEEIGVGGLVVVEEGDDRDEDACVDDYHSLLLRDCMDKGIIRFINFTFQ